MLIISLTIIESLNLDMKRYPKEFKFYHSIVIERLLQIPKRIRRQRFIGGVLVQGDLSGIAPVYIASVATALLFRDELTNIIQELYGNCESI